MPRKRLRLMTADKDVHKVPALDLAGWFTLCPESGPTSAFLPIHKQFLAQNETSLLLAFHPSAISSSVPSISNGKLPLTIYETVYEGEPAKQDDSMQIDGEDTSGLRFRSIPYTIETDETEMIAVDYVAKGGGNAAAVGSGDAEAPALSEAEEKEDRKCLWIGRKAVVGPLSGHNVNQPTRSSAGTLCTSLSAVISLNHLRGILQLTLL